MLLAALLPGLGEGLAEPLGRRGAPEGLAGCPAAVPCLGVEPRLVHGFGAAAGQPHKHALIGGLGSGEYTGVPTGRNKGDREEGPRPWPRCGSRQR